MGKKNLLGFLLVSLVYIFGTFTLCRNQANYFAEIEDAYRHHDSYNLDENLTADDLAEMLLSHDYVADTIDARLVARTVVNSRREHGAFANLGALNLDVNRLSASTIIREGGETLKDRLGISRQKLGVIDSVVHASSDVPQGHPVIRVTVTRPDTVTGWRGWLNKVCRRTQLPVAGVPVRLTEHIAQVKSQFDPSPDRFVSVDTVLAYGLTDELGEVCFPVEQGHFYSVVPVLDGFEYGPEKGTTGSPIAGMVTNYSFVQREHKLTPLSSHAYSRIKESRALTVRTPSQWKDSLVLASVLFLMAWWIGYFFIAGVDKRLGRMSDHLLLVSLMALTAICLLAMFSIADPLVDRLLGADMAWGVFWGVVALCGMSSVNYARFYNSQSGVQLGVVRFDFFLQALQWVVKPFMEKLDTMRHRPCGSRWKHVALSVAYWLLGLPLAVVLLPIQWAWWLLARLGKLIGGRQVSFPEGIGYLLIAVLLVVLLFLFGSGPEGSGARVNLGPLQPSEVSKYLVVVFMSTFFAANANRIRAFSGHIDRLNAWFQVRTVLRVVIGIALLLSLYLLLVSDMGPALVLIVTFVLLYSVARGDSAQLALGMFTFILVLLLGRVINNTPLTMTIFSLLWLCAWIVGWWTARRQVYESAVMMNLLIVVFMQAGSWLTAMGLTEGERLTRRNAVVWSGVWNNDVPGGDQVAQGLWSLATGGMSGQGLGKGNPSLVPAFNTDMAFTSIGEVMGWFALVLIVICLAILLHRSLLLARRTGHPFLFFLASGIAIVTGVQFFVIVLGSLGIIPLTGVAVPLLSYGKSSLIMNLAAFGVVISCSRHVATTAQRRSICAFDNVVATSSAVFLGLSVLLLAVLFYYQALRRGETLVRPAYIANVQGARIAEYNPRIGLLMNSLDAGNIYDRNGLLLATSSAGQLRASIDELGRNGLTPNELRTLSRRKLRRYYPFAEHTFFMLGDYNTRVLWNNNDADPYGYMAENRHLAQLRGFDNRAHDKEGKMMIDTVESHAYRYNRFLPATKRVFTFARYDYSALLPMLKQGTKSAEVKRWNERRNQRDITLTLDARLQLLMQCQMADFIQSDPALRAKTRVRASVVVLDARTGDLLTSSCYPLPDQQLIAQNAEHGYNDRYRNFRAYTDRDLGMTYQTQPGSTAKVMSALAGLMKMGDTAAKTTYTVYADEAVHVGAEPTGAVTMQDAIVRSSNNYFVHLVNDKDLYHELDSIYRMAGLRVHISDKRNVSRTPYYFELDPTFTFAGEMDVMRTMGIGKYTTYMTQNRRHKHERFNWFETGNAWGQHNILATPLNMARVVAMVACDGKFAPTRYVLRQGTGEDAQESRLLGSVRMASGTAALRHFMQLESDKHRRNHPLPGSAGSEMRMGGKTGTPERLGVGNRRINDAWYICFMNSGRQHGPLAVAVRIERSEVGSAKAVDFVSRVVVPALNAAGYQIQ